jgi:hypothetical protein
MLRSTSKDQIMGKLPEGKVTSGTGLWHLTERCAAE